MAPRATGRLSALVLAAGVAQAAPCQGQPAPAARPQGGTVAAGSATISQTGALTRIDQASPRVALDWRSFDIGRNQRVDFQQPSASAVALNRVTGPDASQIAGTLTANGQVVLINQSGVVFAKGARVDAQSLVVSAAGMSNENFMAGRMVFDQPARPDASIVNKGRITVKQAGLAALVAPRVKNSGVISAKLGHVILAGAATETLDLYGDGLYSFDVTGQVKQAPLGPDGKPVTALVTNTGTIEASGGTVLLTAEAADGVIQTLLSAGGTISAGSVGDRTGTVMLHGTGGALVVQGAVSASGKEPGTRGGSIELAGRDDVVLTPTARLDASGPAGGGTIALGTTLARARGGASASSAVTARRTGIAKGATIAADATANGDGGRVTVLSTEATVHEGNITARGGQQGGDGGFVEVSGEKGFTFDGGVDLSAPKGQAGNLLLDPTTLTIIDCPGSCIASQDINFRRGDGTLLASASGTPSDTLGIQAIAGVTGTITIQAVADISVAAPITLTIPGQALFLQAGRNLTIQPGAPVSTQGAITLSAATSSIAGFDATGGLTIGAPVTTTGAALNLLAGAGGIAVNSSLNAPNSTLTFNVPGGGVSQSAGSTVTVSRLAGDVGTLTLGNQANSIGSIGPLNVQGAFSLSNSGPLTVDGAVNAGSGFQLSTSGTLTVNGSITTGSGFLGLQTGSGDLLLLGTLSSQFVQLQSDGAINENGTGRILTPVLSTPGSLSYNPVLDIYTLTGGVGSAVLDGPNAVGRISALLAKSDLTFNNTIPLAIDGTMANFSNNGTSLSVAGDVTLAAGGQLISLRPGGSTLSPPLTLNLSGALVETDGFLRARSLTGSANRVSLNGSVANAVFQIGPFDAPGGFALNNDRSVAVVGPVNAGPSFVLTTGGGIALSADVTAGAIGLGGVDAITQGASARLVASSLRVSSALGSIILPGTNQIASLSNANSPASVAINTIGNLALNGNIQTPDLTVDAAGSITQGPGTGITAGTLSGTFGSATLTGASNAVQSLGPISASTGGFSLTTTTPLAVAAPIALAGSGSAAPLTLASSGGLIIRAAAPITAGDVSLADSAGGITLGAPLASNGRLSLNAPFGAVTQTLAAGITAASLSGSFAAGLLGAPANAIQTLGPITAQNALQLSSRTPLTATGPITLAGPLTTLVINANAGLTTQPAAPISATGNFQLNVGADSTLNGDVSAGNQFLIRGAPGAGVTSTGGLTAATLSGLNVPLRFARFLGRNNVANVTNFVVQDELSFTGNAQPLTVLSTLEANAGFVRIQSDPGIILGRQNASSGSITALANGVSGSGTVTLASQAGITEPNGSINATTLNLLSGGNLVLNGDITAGSLEVDANGTISRTGGALNVGTLSGSALHLADFGANPQIGTLGRFSVTGSELVLHDGEPLTIAGPVVAQFIRITAPGSITLTGNIATAGLPLSLQSGAAPADPGSYIVVLPDRSGNGVFTQLGASAIVPFGVPVATLRIGVPGRGGSILLGDLVGPGADLALDLGTGGTALGALFVDRLLVRGAGGSARLIGQVAGIGGFGAAALARIEPASDRAYTLNSCAIGAVTCIWIQDIPHSPLAILRSLEVPRRPILKLMAVPRVPTPLGWMSGPDVVPPNVGQQDY